jgi:hypothetical protein
MGQKIASKAKRLGGAERLPDPAVPKRIAVDGAGTGCLLLRWKCSQKTWPETAWARMKTAEKNKKSAYRKRLSLDNWGPHTG